MASARDRTVVPQTDFLKSSDEVESKKNSVLRTSDLPACSAVYSLRLTLQRDFSL